MKVIWTPEAQQDRLDIWNYIEAENLPAAASMDELFTDAVAKLANYPMLGQPGKISGTRELVPHGNYRLVYEIQDETVWILALVHVARQWPPVRG